MPNQFDRIINFVKKTGDKTIVIKEDAEFVIAPLLEYEKLIDAKHDIKKLSEEELLDKINREIAVWRESQEERDGGFDALADYSEIEDDGEDEVLYEELPDKVVFPPNSPWRERDDLFADMPDEDKEWGIEGNDYDGRGDDWSRDDGLSEDGVWDNDDDVESVEDDESVEDGEYFDVPAFESIKKEVKKEEKKSDQTSELEKSRKNEKFIFGNDNVDEGISEEGRNGKKGLVDIMKSSHKSSGPVPKRVNNFGYPNPSDTVENVDKEDAKDEYGHITPPPSL